MNQWIKHNREKAVLAGLVLLIGGTVAYLKWNATSVNYQISKYQNIQLSYGTYEDDIIQELGEPDSFSYPAARDLISMWGFGKKMAAAIAAPQNDGHKDCKLMQYSPFAATGNKKESLTKYRVNLLFVQDQLFRWRKEVAPKDEPISRGKDIPLEFGITEKTIKSQLGEPDSFTCPEPQVLASKWGLNAEMCKEVCDKKGLAWDEICYLPFAAIGTDGETCTRYRLNLLISGHTLVRWRREAAPTD